ncbi:MAG: hypothetical protein V4772_21250 [Pseudomonadota bacterium]
MGLVGKTLTSSVGGAGKIGNAVQSGGIAHGTYHTGGTGVDAAQYLAGDAGGIVNQP